MVRAEGCHVFDASGRRYLDLESGVWCTSIGHGHPRILDIMLRQARMIAHNGFNYSSPVVEEAAREILSLLGFENGGRCVFLCSGSEAVEYGVRVAQMVVDRPLLMTLADSYFGAYGSASRKSEAEWFLYDWLDCPDCRADGIGDCRGGCARWGAIPFDRIGGFLFEPGSSSGLVRFPPVGLVERIAREVQGRGGFLLVNEVTTGIGRTGRWFGYEHYAVQPDVVAMGKGIGNGYPVSVTAFGERIAQQLGDRPVKYAQSHQNDPLGTAVALEVVRVIREEGLVERAREMGEVFGQGLDGISERCGGRIRAIRHRGLMAAIEVADGLENPLTIGTHRRMLERGFLVGRRPGVPVLRIDPPLTIGREDLESLLENLELSVTP
jgi:acetylornithine aminotransferase